MARDHHLAQDSKRATIAGASIGLGALAAFGVGGDTGIGRKRRRVFMLRYGLLSVIGASSFTAAVAESGADRKLAESLLRPGYALAHESAALVHDINNDGRKDVLMAVERNCAEGSGGPPCEADGGERSLEVHYGQPDGSYRLAIRSGLMMARDEGGMDQEPFNGFTVTPKGSVVVSFSGGAGWVWEYRYTLQFRKDDVYVIGASEYHCSGARSDVECRKADVNLLTGRWHSVSWVGESARRTRQGVTRSNRLYRLKDAFPGMDPCAPPPRPDWDPNKHVTGGPQSGFSCDAPSRRG